MSGENPYRTPAGWTNDAFRDPELAKGLLPRGLVGHVPIVASLLLIQGILELLFGMLGFGVLLLVMLGPQKELEGLRGLGYLMAGAGGVATIAGLLRLVAGLFNLRYRRRGLGLIALGAGLLTLLTGYCAPTAIALAIYGLIVYVNEPVMIAFQLGDSGRSTAEIQRSFAPRS